MHDQWRVEEYEIAYHDVAILSFSDFLTRTTNGDLQVSLCRNGAGLLQARNDIFAYVCG